MSVSPYFDLGVLAVHRGRLRPRYQHGCGMSTVACGGPLPLLGEHLVEDPACPLLLVPGDRPLAAFMVGQVLIQDHEGTLVLDCEGLSKFVSDHEPVVALIAEARRRGMEVVVSALTIIEAVHRRTDRARLAWLSGVWIVHVGEEEAKAASAMLINAGLNGHEYAIDAAVAEMALRQRRPVVMLASDVDDMTRLCGGRVRLVAV